MRSTGTNQRGEMVLDYVRWVMVHKRDPQAAVGAPVVPKTAAAVAPADLIVPADLTLMATTTTRRARRIAGRTTSPASASTM